MDDEKVASALATAVGALHQNILGGGGVGSSGQPTSDKGTESFEISNAVLKWNFPEFGDEANVVRDADGVVSAMPAQLLFEKIMHPTSPGPLHSVLNREIRRLCDRSCYCLPPLDFILRTYFCNHWRAFMSPQMIFSVVFKRSARVESRVQM